MPDEKGIFEVIRSLERISNKINLEIKILKKKLKISDLDIGLKNYHLNFFHNVLEPLFKEKKYVSISDIKYQCEITGKININESTIHCYLSNLNKNNYIEIIQEENDKRKHLYRIK